MNTYLVVIPVLKRTEEHHFVEAVDEADAIQRVLDSDKDPFDWVEDPDYYEPQKSSACAKLVQPPIEDGGM